MKYAFIERHEHEHGVRRMCLCLQVHPSGYYAWKADPMSARAHDDQRLLGLLKHAWLESGGNCHDNAVAESFFQLLKRERIRRQIYPTCDAAKTDVFNYIEMFYNPKRRHGTAGDTSPVEFERRHSQRLKSV